MDIFAFRDELVAEYERRILDRGDSRHAGPPGVTFRRVGGEIEDDLGEEAEAAASARAEVRLDRNPGLSDPAADGAGRRRSTCKSVR